MERLPFNHDLPAQRYTVALDGAQYEVRLVYRDRRDSWYLDLADATGRWLVRGRRLSPLSSPHAGLIVDGPPGILVATGADPYDRHEIELWYVTAAERAAARASLAASKSAVLPLEIST